MKVRGLRLAAVLLVSFISQLCVAQEITVAAAADLQFAMQDVAARFQKATGKTVNLTYGSSGNFFQQIQILCFQAINPLFEDTSELLGDS